MGRTFARDDFNLGEIEGAYNLTFLMIISFSLIILILIYTPLSL